MLLDSSQREAPGWSALRCVALWPLRAPHTGCLNRMQPSNCRIVQRCAGSLLQAHSRTWQQCFDSGIKPWRQTGASLMTYSCATGSRADM